MSETIDSRRARAILRLLGIIDALREHCAWTRRLTHASLVEYLVEESYELVEAIEDQHAPEEVRGELADVLLQILLHASIAEDHGHFDFADVADALSEKMIRRNKHVFAPDGSLLGEYPESIEEIIASWDAAKRAEKLAAAPAAETAEPNPFAGLPRHLPALALADKALRRAERWKAQRFTRPPADSPDDVDASRAPSSYPQTGGGAAAPQPDFSSEQELGEHLLELVHHAQARGWDAERALRGAVTRFTGDVTRALG